MPQHPGKKKKSLFDRIFRPKADPKKDLKMKAKKKKPESVEDRDRRMLEELGFK